MTRIQNIRQLFKQLVYDQKQTAHTNTGFCWYTLSVERADGELGSAVHPVYLGNSRVLISLEMLSIGTYIVGGEHRNMLVACSGGHTL